jgi:XRE family transcriptional regulator, fatty acid utilization regulator
MDTKLFLGAKLRRLRKEHGLSQADLARLANLSPSYLNQIERDQRPMSATVMLRVGAALGMDPRALADTDAEGQLLMELREALADPLFQTSGLAPVSSEDLHATVATAPALGRTMLALYRRYRALVEADTARAAEGDDMFGGQGPYEEVRDYFHRMDNYFDGLERAAEELHSRLGLRVGDVAEGLTSYLHDHHGVRVRIDAQDRGSLRTLRRYDPATRILTVSEALQRPAMAFQIAYQIALLDHSAALDALIEQAGFTAPGARPICRVGLANHFAGALLMPYREFLNSAEACWYDIEQLQRRFDVSFEQAAHRLSALRRPGAQGVPFYFARVDKAGNISKRQSAPRFHFARFGGACPLWNVHEAFAAPGRILVQLARMPDGTTYLCLARTVTKGGGGYMAPRQEFAVGIGCEVGYAHRLVYGAAIDLTNRDSATPIGPGCRVCERQNCHQRAFPPLSRPVSVDDNARSFVPYSVSR